MVHLISYATSSPSSLFEADDPNPDHRTEVLPPNILSPIKLDVLDPAQWAELKTRFNDKLEREEDGVFDGIVISTSSSVCRLRVRRTWLKPNVPVHMLLYLMSGPILRQITYSTALHSPRRPPRSSSRPTTS